MAEAIVAMSPHDLTTKEILMGPTLKSVAAVTLLALQVLAFAYHRSVPTKYFCWAPHDYHNVYSLRVRVGDRELTPDEIDLRYRGDTLNVCFKDDELPKKIASQLFPTNTPDPSTLYLGLYHPGPAANVFDTIQQREETLSPPERGTVIMRFSANGRAPEEWRWPLGH